MFISWISRDCHRQFWGFPEKKMHPIPMKKSVLLLTELLEVSVFLGTLASAGFYVNNINSDVIQDSKRLY